MYWSLDGEFIYPENFRSLTDCVFQFKFKIRSFKLLNWLSFKSRTFNTCKWPRWAKNKTFLTKFFANNKSVESTDYETGLPNAASSEILIENTDKGSKA